MTNVPQEPDEFQTRMRLPEGDDTGDTHRSGPPTPEQSPFAPPGFGGASQPQPAAPPQGYGAPAPQQAPGPQQAPAQQGYAQPPQGFGQHSQPAFGQQPQGAPFGQQPSQQQPTFGQGQPAQAGYPQQPAQTGWGALPQQPPREAGPLKAAFDLGFGSYATPGIVKIVYILGIVLAVLSYIATAVAAFAVFAPTRDIGFGAVIAGTPVPGIIAILIGWIPAAFFVLALRVGLEHALANVRAATDVKALRERSDEDASTD